MSFETDNNQRNTEEQSLDQNVIENKSDQNNKENDLNRIVDVAMSAYYYRKFLLVFFLLFICIVLALFFALGIARFGSEDIQMSHVSFALFIAIQIVFLISFIRGAIFLYKSTRAFCRIREEIVPHAKSTIIKSWIALFIYLGILVFVQSILPDIVLPNVLITPTFVKTLSPSLTEWYILLVILIPAIYSFGVFALFIYRIKQKFVPDKIPGWLATLFFVCLYPVAIYCYVDKIYRFFSNQFGYKTIEKIYIL